MYINVLYEGRRKCLSSAGPSIHSIFIIFMKQREQNLIKKFQKFFPLVAATAACIETSTFNNTNYQQQPTVHSRNSNYSE